MRGGALAISSACAWACSSPVGVLSSDGLSAVILVTDTRTSVRAEALALVEGGAIRRDVDPDATLYALGYAAPLEQLGITPGVLALVDVGQELPTPERIDAFVEGAWSTLGTAPLAVTRLRIPGGHACPTFEWKRLDVPEVAGDAVTVAVSLDPDRVFLATAFGRFFVATESGLTAVALSTTTPHLTGTRAGDDVWLASADGTVVHGHPDRGFVAAPPVPFATPFGSSLSGSGAGAPVEVFAIDAELRAAHFDGTAWRTLRDTPTPYMERPRRKIAWVAAGLAIVTGAAVDRIEELHASGLSQVVPLDIPPRPSIDAPWNAALIDGVGAVVGTRNDVLYRRDGGAWTRLVIPSTNPRSDVMLGLGDGRMISGGENSFFVAWKLDGTTCDVDMVPVGGGVHAVARTREGFLASASNSGGPPIVVWAKEVR